MLEVKKLIRVTKLVVFAEFMDTTKLINLKGKTDKFKDNRLNDTIDLYVKIDFSNNKNSSAINFIGRDRFYSSLVITYIFKVSHKYFVWTKILLFKMNFVTN